MVKLQSHFEWRLSILLWKKLSIWPRKKLKICMCWRKQKNSDDSECYKGEDTRIRGYEDYTRSCPKQYAWSVQITCQHKQKSLSKQFCYYILLTMSASTATTKESFSAINKIKSNFRTTMRIDRRSALSMLCYTSIVRYQNVSEIMD